MMLAAKTPVAKTIASVRKTPSPGTCIPSQPSVRHAAGSSSSVWSIMLTSRFSTHRVMTRGTQIRSPVMK
ncbi:hypothetical protein D3C83_239670 [compost metagenome]